MSRQSQPKALRPRKDPSQARAAETVASIIEAAAQILETEGLQGFNTNAIAQRAGVSIGSVYQYFPGKDALTVALIKRETARFHDDAAMALGKRSGKAALEYLIGAAVRQQLQRPMLARLLDLEETRPALRGETVKSDAMTTLLLTIVKRARPTLEHPEMATADVMAIIKGMVDAAGERGENDIDSLEIRVRAGVFGYLSRAALRRTT